MDELEIAGQRYLSTRRAGKEHKYHSDYIGQLIRGGKVVGKKVGRSWYVEENSLNAYLSGEDQRTKPVVKKAEPAPTAQLKPEPVVIAPVTAPVVVAEPEATPSKVETQIEEPAPVQTSESNKIFIQSNNFNTAPVRRVPVADTHVIPIKNSNTTEKASGLRYISDDAPSLPAVQTTKIPVVVSEQVPTYTSEYLPPVEEVQGRKFGMLSLATLAVIGVITLSVTVGASVAISFHTTIEEGQVAGAGYTLK